MGVGSTAWGLGGRDEETEKEMKDENTKEMRGRTSTHGE